eukprot:TRINITY_DN3256_c0_g3_i1.p1 TRINITY_DN3256_c0_g3~~TRINITY_DN3256_c0_g3_i1.p1  ORF type:complete len:161 (+),score=3.62 TRINITY_DN3256_c0_g3_i1:55-537(+)
MWNSQEVGTAGKVTHSVLLPVRCATQQIAMSSDRARVLTWQRMQPIEPRTSEAIEPVMRTVEICILEHRLDRERRDVLPVQSRLRTQANRRLRRCRAQAEVTLFLPCDPKKRRSLHRRARVCRRQHADGNALADQASENQSSRFHLAACLGHRLLGAEEV